MSDAWIGAEEAAQRFGYSRHHLYKMAREGMLRTRPAATGRRWGEREFEVNAIRAHVTRPVYRRHGSKAKRLAAWLQANRLLWKLPRTELRERAMSELGFTVGRTVFGEALLAARCVGRHYKSHAAERWLRAHAWALYERPMAMWRMYCRDEESVSSTVFTEAMRKIKKELSE